MEELAAELIDHRWGSDAPGQPWLGFEAGGRLHGSDGCNRLMGEWTLTAQRADFGRLVSTMMFCEGVDTWLNGAVSARLLHDASGDRLEVLDAAGRVIGVLPRTVPDTGVTA
ncbi:META domain-containing protein [Citricoccus sp. K5]|uniref:META domain-containing protein n=1 Tax=Citricoccus sp. K5 TaxID=2653135 RepID=UPI0012F335D7|nr:META domain-containing protein [Citricoccus sp. K5]VXB16001.1 META domain-containing protein [Citricoccus sp. K5]